MCFQMVFFLSNQLNWHSLYCFGFNLKKKSCRKSKYLQSTVEYLTEYLTIHIWRSRKTLLFTHKNQFYLFIGGEFQCKGHIVPHSNPTSIGCCSDEDYCNLKLKGVEYELPPMDPIGPDTEGGSMQFELMVLLCSLTAIFIVALLIIVLFFLYYE